MVSVGPRIFVLDAEPSSRASIVKGLRGAGFQVSAPDSSAGGPLDALRRELARDKPPGAAVLCTGESSVASSVACLRAIRSNPHSASIPVIMVTAKPSRDMVLQIAKIGVQSLLANSSSVSQEIVKRLEMIGICPATTPPNQTVTAIGKEARSTSDRADTQAGPPLPPNVQGSASQPCTTVEDAAESERESLEAGLFHLDGTPDMERAIEELKRLKPLMSRTHLLERVIGDIELKAARPAVQQVLHLTASDRASLEAIAKAMKQDQALSLKILKLANSAIYARPDRVDTVQKAVARIGVAQVRATVLSLAVVEQFGHVKLADRLRADWFWEHSIATGLFATKIARLRGASPDEIDSMFLAGLLHDIGRIVLAERLGETYSGVLDVADQLELPVEVVESRLLLINHADLTDRLLRSWRFPLDLINPIAMHHLSMGNIRRTVPRQPEPVATLALANALSHALCLGSSGNNAIYPLKDYLEFLSLDGEKLGRLVSEVPDETLDLKLMMLAHASHPSGSAADELCGQLELPNPPMVITLRPEPDPVSLFFQHISPAAPADQEHPCLIVLRVTEPNERALLMERLRAAEARAGAIGTPVLVIADARSGFFQEGWLGTRPVAQLTLPIRITRLAHAVSEIMRMSTGIRAASSPKP